jgi:hypothetical protein
MQVNCPYCDKKIDVTDRLPDKACDENEIDCECGAELVIGWYAEAEIRDSKAPIIGGLRSQD